MNMLIWRVSCITKYMVKIKKNELTASSVEQFYAKNSVDIIEILPVEDYELCLT